VSIPGGDVNRNNFKTLKTKTCFSHTGQFWDLASHKCVVSDRWKESIQNTLLHNFKGCFLISFTCTES